MSPSGSEGKEGRSARHDHCIAERYGAFFTIPPCPVASGWDAHSSYGSPLHELTDRRTLISSAAAVRGRCCPECVQDPSQQLAASHSCCDTGSIHGNLQFSGTRPFFNVLFAFVLFVFPICRGPQTKEPADSHVGWWQICSGSPKMLAAPLQCTSSRAYGGLQLPSDKAARIICLDGRHAKI